MRSFTCLVLCLLFGSMAFADDTVKEKPKPEDFLGKWKGKWDGVWAVQFTITQDPQTKQLTGLYEWEENVGQAMRQEKHTAMLDGNVLRVGRGLEITLSAKDADKGKVVGKFAKPRSSDLVRVKEKP